ncbi:Alpha/beta hydrolase family protein [Geodermatophilus pulveris]|uniref:Alpha/beta hydrolase family protein n=1 Tax=Geodermatophilus pulveris TaxID=1564159 RepID=A0A239FVH8_9ACTN|nr:alpha/beta fold hydrolase [Geodermatophilus pulveris]SNS60820.1 Alpha/beta hydrolase family protein [Geodermatophilus pulveris]
MTDPARDPELISVPVQGGQLAALHWAADAPGAPIAVLLHGITGNAMAWARVAGALAGGFEVVAPDLRGRAASAGLPGPYGIEAHAADVAALLDHLGADRDAGAEAAVLVGHSMGAFVAALATAGTARDRVHGLVLVDGGLALPQPPGADLDAMLSAFLGPSLARLGMTFPDLAAVRAFWAQHPAVGPWVDVPSVAAYLARDMVQSPAPGSTVGEPPALRSACVPEAVRVDGGDVLRNERVLEATTDLPVPATLLWATRGLLDQTPGLYDEVRLAQLGLERSGITAREVPDTNHYSVIWASQGVEAVAAAVRDAAARS